MSVDVNAGWEKLITVEHEIHQKAAKSRNLSAAKFLKGKIAKLTCSENFMFYSNWIVVLPLLSTYPRMQVSELISFYRYFT